MVNVQEKEFHGMVTEIFRPGAKGSPGHPDVGEAVLFFHGYPGPDPSNPNPGLALQLGPKVAESGRSLFAPQARGLVRSPGTFSFAAAVESASLCTDLADGFPRVSVVGYSFGALLGARAYASLPRERRGALVFLAPVSQPFPKEALHSMIALWRREFPQSLKGYPCNDSLCRELRELTGPGRPSVSLQGVSCTAVTILHGSADEIIPLPHSEILARELALPERRLVRLEGQIHGFPDRPGLVRRILEALDEGRSAERD
jgi:pimeloyl-ACP methyl ester carboxylesterase